MRIADKTGCHFTIKRIEADPHGDIRAKVSTAGYGFSGANRSVWFHRAEIDRFIAALRRLEETRKGSTTLETMSPGECVLTFRSFDQLGHIHLDIAIARAVYFFGETDHLRCHIRFEIDPTVFKSTVRDLENELARPQDLT